MAIQFRLQAKTPPSQYEHLVSISLTNLVDPRNVFRNPTPPHFVHCSHPLHSLLDGFLPLNRSKHFCLFSDLHDLLCCGRALKNQILYRLVGIIIIFIDISRFSIGSFEKKRILLEEMKDEKKRTKIKDQRDIQNLFAKIILIFNTYFANTANTTTIVKTIRVFILE